MSIQIPVPESTAVGRHNLNVFVDKIDGEAASESEQGKYADPFVAYNNGFLRQQSYIETYNSQNSAYGPLVNDEYTKVDKDNDACVVNIYQKGEPLAVESSLYLNDLYAYTLQHFKPLLLWHGRGSLCFRRERLCRFYAKSCIRRSTRVYRRGKDLPVFRYGRHQLFIRQLDKGGQRRRER